ncbi:hypothetical protein [Sabulicella rubraurantiaca]|uniref:hypothetical protein n=1 Tax=Sabulicella rubraurantiaca TaxID=2811429 RepID=UPI001A962E9E|nr:hypothetical protein [Sabulicella rubraurantiaca]
MDTPLHSLPPSLAQMLADAAANEALAEGAGASRADDLFIGQGGTLTEGPPPRGLRSSRQVPHAAAHFADLDLYGRRE